MLPCLVKLIPEYKTASRLIIFLILAGFFIAPKVIFGQILINEIMYDLAKDDCVADGADTDREWVELYNNSTNPITLSGGSKGWRFNDGSSHLLSESPAQGSMTISPAGYAILTADAPTFLQEHSGFQGTIISTAMSLKNATGTLMITDPNGNKNEVAYQNSLGAKHNCKTLEWDGAALKESAVDSGTPGRANSVLSPGEATPSATPSSSPIATTSVTPSPSATAQTFDYSQDILINEFLPAPSEGEKEWVELFNAGSSVVNLSGWQIDDADNSTSPQIIPEGTTIYANGFLVVSFNKSTLNNEGDKVRLLWPDDQVVHAVSYDKAKPDQSVAKFNNSWLWTNQPTPGQANKKSAIENNEPVVIVATAEKINSIEESVVASASQTPNKKTLASQTITSSTPIPSATAQTAGNPENINLSAAIGEPIKKTSGSNAFISLAGVILLAGLAASALIYFRRRKAVDSQNPDD